MFLTFCARAGLLALLLLATWAPAGPAWASSVLPTTPEQDWQAADAVCRGTVLRLETIQRPNGRLVTRVRIRVDEILKGQLPPELRLFIRGGVTPEGGETDGLAPRLHLGEERTFHLRTAPDGRLEILNGFAGTDALTPGKREAKLRRLRDLRARLGGAGATLTAGGDDAPGGSVIAEANGTGGALGLLVDSNNVPARFIAPDRGEPIPYLVDAQTLPAGVTQAQALTAVSNALAAWSAETGVQFRFDGLQNFGQSAASIGAQDGVLRIQLHDSYGEISSSSVLGVGGYAWTTGGSSFNAVGGYGGRVGAQEFHRAVRGYLVLEHTNASMSDLETLEEVLCHEVGHALGLAHSSEDPAEADLVKNGAMMYYRISGTNRGATLGTYDPPMIRKLHPLGDTPPWTFDRVVTLITASPQITQTYTLFGNDLQSASTALTVVQNGLSAGSGATFSFDDATTLRATPSGFYGDSTVSPESGSYYGLKWYRVTDLAGNASPWSQVRVVGFRTDTRPVGAADGLPDSWMTTHFGSTTPSAGTSGPNDDPDRDGHTNLEEYRMGTSPVDANARLSIATFANGLLTFPATSYQLYRIESATDLSAWTPVGGPVQPTTATGTAAVTLPAEGTRQYRVSFVP